MPQSSELYAQRATNILSLSFLCPSLLLQKLCLSSLKRAWSSYLRANYDYFLRQVTRTPSPPPPAATPAPTADTPQLSAASNEGSKKKKKKKKKKKGIKMNRAVSTLNDDMPGSIHSLIKGKTRNNFGSQSRLSRVSTRNSKGRVCKHSPHLTLADSYNAMVPQCFVYCAVPVVMVLA